MGECPSCLIASLPYLQRPCIRERMTSNKCPLGVVVFIGGSGDGAGISGPQIYGDIAKRVIDENPHRMVSETARDTISTI